MTTEPAPVRAAEKSPTQSGSGSGNGRFFAISAFALFTLLACSNLPTPLYRLYAQAFHFSPLTLTLVFAVYVGTMVPSLLVFGPLSDAIGRRPVLVGATAAAVAAMLVFMLATSTPWLLLARGLQGVAVGAASGALTAALSEFEPRQNRDRAALATTVASLGGLAAGPLIAGSLASTVRRAWCCPMLRAWPFSRPCWCSCCDFPIAAHANLGSPAGRRSRARCFAPSR